MIFAGIRCEVCEKSLLFKHTTKANITKHARGLEWSIGKECVCPSCKEQRKGVVKA